MARGFDGQTCGSLGSQRERAGSVRDRGFERAGLLDAGLARTVWQWRQLLFSLASPGRDESFVATGASAFGTSRPHWFRVALSGLEPGRVDEFLWFPSHWAGECRGR